ncbi:retrovirus-related pol polyprotein from transposon TNT 1-94, partial [Tanacetum coccineum]
AKVTTIEDLNDLTSLSLDELIGNLKVHEMIIKKESKIVKAKGERKSLALKANKESSVEECSTSGSEDEEYAIATFQRSRDDNNGKNDRKCFRCGDPNHLIRECPKPLKDKNQRAFVGGSWSNSGEENDEKVKDKTCLVGQPANEVCSESSYFSDENSSIDDLVLDNEYDKLCKMSLKIITKNKRLKATRNSLEKKLSILKEKVSTLEKNKEVDLECVNCHMLKIENEKLKEEAIRLNKFEKSTHCLNEMLSNQKPSDEKLGLEFSSFEALSSGTKEIKFVKAQKKASFDGGPINMGGPHSAQAAPIKIFMGPPAATLGSEKSNWNLFSTYKAYNRGNVIFGSNLHGNIISKGKICDDKGRVTFFEHDSEITKDGKEIRPRNMRLIQSLASKELVRNLPKLKFDQHFCDAYKIRKQAHSSHKAKNIVSTTRCLELLQMDLFGPSVVRSYRGNRYTLVIVDDYSRCTWTRFLKDKTEAFDQFEIFSKKIQNQLGCTIVSIRTDHGREFDSEVQFEEFCNANGITYNFSAPSTPQSNGVVERKNRTLQEMSRTMLNEQSLPQKFWCNAIDTSTCILKQILIRAILGKTPYEILRGRKPTLEYFRVFGSMCFILNTKDYLTKFDPKSYEGVFLGYSQNSKAYIILNKHTRKIEESLNVTFDETPPPSKTSPLVDDDLDEEEVIRAAEIKNLENVVEDETLEIDKITSNAEGQKCAHPQLGPERARVYSDLSPEDKDRYNADIRATNILLQGLPEDIYTLINHYTEAKDIWDNVKMLLEVSKLTKEDRESQLYNEFEHFRQNKGETIHDYYVWFAKLIKDMRNIKMTMYRMQLNSKFVNNMLPEWGRFVTAVKLNRGLRDSNYDQLYAYLKQHEAHANKNKMMLDRFTQHTVDPLAFLSNVSHQQTSSNTRKQAAVQDDRVVVQNVQGRQNKGQGNNVRGAGAAGYGGAQNRVRNSNPGRQDNVIDEDVDEQPVQDLALNVNNVFQANDCDAFDSDVDEAPTAQTMFIENLSSSDHVYDEASLSYDLGILSEVHDHDHYQDVVCEHHEVYEMHDDVQPNYIVDSHADYTSDSNMIPYDQYVKDNAVTFIQSNVSSIPNDAYMMILNDIYEPSTQCVSMPTQNNVVDNSLTAKLATYKEQVELYKRRAKFELIEREQKINEQLRIVIADRNLQWVEEVTSLKKDFKQKENKYLEEFLDMKALKEKVEDKLYKQDQSLQTVHMLCKPKPYYDEHNKVAIGYKNPLCLTRAKQVQPALYNGHEIIKTNHVPAIVHNSEDTLEIAEITRKKMNDKMKDPECVKKKVKIAPHDYSKENYLATFTPQKQLTPEQIFWSKDLIKMKAEALKEQTTASRPIKALMMYPPNTPATLRITPTGLTEGERGFEQTKECYLTEVIPFFKTLKEHFKGIQKALTKEIKEMKEIFEELEAEVDQNVVNRKHDEIKRKNLLIANDNLIADCLSKEVFYIATNSELTVSRFTEMHAAHTVVQARCLELEAELSKLLDKVQKDDHTELVKRFSNLEVNHLNLQLKYQNLKESFGNNTSPPARDAPDFDSVFVIKKMKASIQGKDNAIKKLRMQISQLKETRSEADRTLDFRALDFQITQLTEKVNVLQEQNELFRAENEKVKQHYKELYDSIKITRAKHIEQTTALLTDNENLKAQIHENLKCITMDSVKPRVLAPGRYAIDVEPIPPRNRNNREVHLDYLKHLKESVETLREIVEEAKVERPLDSSLASACLYTKHSQELLEYVIGTCPKDFNQRDKKHAATPLTRKKQVTFEDQCETSNSNTHTNVAQLNIQKTNVPVPPSTGVNSCTDASGSQPRSNTKKNRILPAKSVNKKKVEEHPRTNKSSLKTTNRIDSSISSKRTVINLNSHSVCKTCNKCLIYANHDMCVVNYFHSVNASPSVKNVVRKVQQVWKPKQVKQVWKPTGKILTNVGYHWMPTRRTFTLGEQCPLTRLTKAKVVPAKQTENITIGDSVISRVYYVEGLGHNLFFVGQFCDSDPEVAFRKHSCYVRHTDGVELFKGSHGSNFYTILVEDMMKSSPICLLSKASKNKSWLWHRRLNHLNFGTINDLARKDLVRGLPRLKFEKDHLCSACQLGKSKKHTHTPKAENTNLEVLNTLHMDLCGPMRVQTINGKKCILDIVDDYSRFTWVKFLRSKDETLENGIVERRNRTLVEAARTMLIFSKAPMFLWEEVVATTCYTNNRSLIHTRHNKTPYELVHDKKPDLTFFRVFGALCYPTNDSEDLGKLQPT